MVPAADISEQISTAGFEASGTGNMKFMMNGALTIGTLDGANIEIADAVGREHMFIFGMTVDDVTRLREQEYDPRRLYEAQPDLRSVLDLIQYDHFSADEPGIFRPIVDSLLNRDYFLCLADFESYRRAHRETEVAYEDQSRWNTSAIRNVAFAGHFSSDRTIEQYAREIWGTPPNAT